MGLGRGSTKNFDPSEGRGGSGYYRVYEKKLKCQKLRPGAPRPILNDQSLRNGENMGKGLPQMDNTPAGTATQPRNCTFVSDNL